MTKRMTTEALRRLIEDCLARCKTGPMQAEAVARALVEAELVGQTTHGLVRVPSYAAQAASGKVDGYAVPEVKKIKTATLQV
ncbi:MAG: Ldh family oxidoreductase, partial [Pseudomonadota bacterium]